MKNKLFFKFYIIYMLLLIILLSSCTKKIEVEPIKEDELIINNITYFYPKLTNIDNELINETIRKEITEMIDSINKASFQVSLDYSYIIMNDIINYSFFYEISKDIESKIIIKKYNYDLISNKKIIINETTYMNLLDYINDYQKDINLSYYDYNLLEFTINKNLTILTIPSFLTHHDNIDIVINDVIYNYELKEPNEKKESKKIAITFDDAPSINSKKIVDLLDRYQIKGTFFVLGKNIEGYEENLKYIYLHNHEIGNHTFNHYQLNKLSQSDVINEIESTQKAIYEIINKYPRIVRFPYGAYSEDILEYIDMPLILWNSDSNDWRYKDKQKVINEAIKDAKDGGIILFHDATYSNLEAIEEVIKILIGLDYKFYTISELLELDSIISYYQKNLYISGSK